MNGYLNQKTMREVKKNEDKGGLNCNLKLCSAAIAFVVVVDDAVVLAEAVEGGEAMAMDVELE